MGPLRRWWVSLAILVAGCSCGDDDDPASDLAPLTEVGSEGGTFTLGGLRGTIPAGAVEDGGTVVVSGEIAQDVTPPTGAIGPVYQLELDREIAEPITLELPYDVADLGGRSPLGLRVASSPDGIIWDCDPATAPREQSSSVLAVVSHMSFWVLRFNLCDGDATCNAPERCFDAGENGYCATPCASDADCSSPTFCFCGICSRASCEGPAGDDCPIGTDCSVAEENQRGVCLPECTPLDRCGIPEEQQLCSAGGRCSFQPSALCPDLFACADDHSCLHQWCVPTDTGCACGDADCPCESPAECPGVDHEECTNGEDDDGDALIDCVDLDCADEPGCSAGLPEDCATPGDEDGDGDADCADDECVDAPECVAEPLTFSDAEFEDPDWVIQDTQISGPISETHRRELAGGNPDAYRAMTHDFGADPGGENIRTFQQYVPASYDPAEEGAIERIDFAIDVRTDRQLGNGFLVFQGGVHFRADYTLWNPAGESWQTHTAAGLTEADFLADDGATTPDFSEAGAPIAFGFMRASSSTPPTPEYHSDHGADNFSVTVHPGGVRPRVEDCATPGDEDRDGDADCADPDCADDPACAEGPWTLSISTLGLADSGGLALQNAQWLGFQDGDGPWVELVGDGGEYTAVVTDPDGRYGLASAGTGDVDQLWILYATAAEGTEVSIPSGGVTLLGDNDLTGQLLGADECSTVAAGHVGFTRFCGVASYGPISVRDITVDILALTGPNGAADLRAYLQRDVAIAGDMTIDIDFAGPDSFDLEAHDCAANTTLFFRSANSGFQITTCMGGEYGGIPLAQQRAGDVHLAAIPGPDGVLERVWFAAPIDLALTDPPPAVPAFTPLTVADEPYPLHAIDLDEPVPAGAEVLVMNAWTLGGAWTVTVTSAWLGANTRIELPDLSTTDGWQAAFAPPADAAGSFGVLAPAVAGEALSCATAESTPRDGLRCLFRYGAAFAF